MIKIGDFSKISKVSVKALRFYDEIGLLRPASIDPFTGYRYYSMEQLARLNRILAFKDLGFSLEQIGSILHQELSRPQIAALLQLKADELRTRLKEDEDRLERIEARLRQIEQEDIMPDYEVVIKKVEPQLVASRRGVTPSYEVIGPILDQLFDEAYGYARRSGVQRVGCGITLYHSESAENGIEIEAAAPLYEPLESGDGVQVYELPGVEQMASTIHHGPFATLSNAYNAMMQWLETNAYRITGPCREINLQYERGSDQSEYVTEIQFPVAKA